MRPQTRTACSVVLVLLFAASVVATGLAVAGPSDLAEQSTVETTTANEATTTVRETTADAEATTASEATTSEAETTTTATADAAEYPPGVTAEGVANASALVAAHQEALAETGYEFTFAENTSFEGIAPEFVENESENRTDDWLYFFNDTTTVTVENGTVARGLAPGRLVANGSIQYDEYRHEFRSDTWANESVMVSRTEYANQLLLQRIDLARDVGEDPFVVARSDVNATLTKADVVNLTLHSGEFEVVETNRSGDQTLFTLEAVEYDGYDAVWLSPENVSTYDATVVVDEAGRVHRLSLTVTGTEYEHVSMHYEFELTHLGPVEVSQPGWAERLRD